MQIGSCFTFLFLLAATGLATINLNLKIEQPSNCVSRRVELSWAEYFVRTSAHAGKLRGMFFCNWLNMSAQPPEYRLRRQKYGNSSSLSYFSFSIWVIVCRWSGALTVERLLTHRYAVSQSLPMRIAPWKWTKKKHDYICLPYLSLIHI